MKKIIYKFSLLSIAGLMLLTSCDKKLNVEPAQSISPDEALSTSKGVETTLIGAYAAMGDADVYGGRIYVAPDLLANSGDVNWSGTFQDMTQIYNKAIPVTNGFVESTWTDTYKAINVANNVLSALDVVVAGKKARVEGEAKFIRASLYFELVKLYAKTYQDGTPASNPGVPLVLKPARGVSEGSARNTVAEVYTQIIADLNDAENLLPESNSYFANKYAAAAMLSRVYLMQGNYAGARDAANRVISSGKFALVAYYPDEFPYPGQIRVENTTEDIFAQQVSDQNGFNSLNQFYGSSADGGRGDIQIEAQHLAKYEAGDERLDLFFDDDGSIRTGKFSNVYGNIRIIRLAEMYLTRAEANFRLGTNVGATPLADINTIRGRVDLVPLITVNLTQILNERYLELAFEGQFLHDIKRTQGTVGVLQWNSPKLIYPIPQREIIVNKNLVQNEGY